MHQTEQQKRVQKQLIKCKEEQGEFEEVIIMLDKLIDQLKQESSNQEEIILTIDKKIQIMEKSGSKIKYAGMIEEAKKLKKLIE